MILTLPWPPSINTYYRSPSKGPLAGRVLISEDGRAYRKAVAAIVRGIKHRSFDVPLAMAIEASPPDRRARDLDNLLKSVLDSLQHAGVYLNDAQIDDLHIRRCSVKRGGSIAVRIIPLVESDTCWRQALGDDVPA